MLEAIFEPFRIVLTPFVGGLVAGAMLLGLIIIAREVANIVNFLRGSPKRFLR